MKVRPAERDDLPQILEIYNEAVLNTTASYDYEPRTLEHRIAWYEEHLKNNYPIFVAQSLAAQGRVVGWSALNPFHTRMGYRFTTENSVYVAPQAQRRGVGRALLDALILETERRGFRQMIAIIGDSSQAPSLALHRAAGFRLIGTLEAVGFKHGRWLDTVLMQRPLGPGASQAP